MTSDAIQEQWLVIWRTMFQGLVQAMTYLLYLAGKTLHSVVSALNILAYALDFPLFFLLLNIAICAMVWGE